MRPRVSWMDVKLGLRMLFKYPGLTLVGGLGLAVGIAISTGAFAFFYGHLYPHLPLPDGDRIVALENWNVQVNNEERRSLHDLVTWRNEMTTVREIGAFRTITRNLVVPGQISESIQVAQITATGLQAAHVPPVLGRNLREADEQEGAAPVLLIDADVWHTRFAGDPNIVGREVRLGTDMHTIVGVMPAGFGFPVNHRFWSALPVNPHSFRRGTGPAIFVFGRLAPGVTFEQAQAELTAIGDRARTTFPDTHTHLRPLVHTYTYPIIDIQGPGSSAAAQLGMTQLFVGLVLVVIALNVAVLVYARTATRHAEITIRTALGASRRRIVGQLFIEALVLSSLAAAGGFALGQFCAKLGNRIMGLETGGTPFWVRPVLAPETLLYVAVLTIVVAGVIGALPALQATGRRLDSGLRQLGGGTKARLGRTWTLLIVAQIAVAVAALPAVAMVAWDAVADASERATFASDAFLAVTVVVEAPGGPVIETEAARQARFSQFNRFQSELRSRLAANPAVAATTLAFTRPGGEPEVQVEVESAPPPANARGHLVRTGQVGVDFFDVVGAGVLTGRTFRSGDQPRSIVVNQTFARRIFGDAPAVGRRLRYVRPEGQQPGPWYEIAGVVQDLHANPIKPELDAPKFFHLVAPETSVSGMVLIQTRGSDPERLIPQVREIAANVDPLVRLTRVSSLDSFEEQEHLVVRLVAIAFGFIAGSVLLLSAAGIYAMMSFTVAQRRREIGIRAALGADPRQVLRSIFGRAVWQLGLGVIVGAVLLAGVDPVMGGELMDGKAAILLPSMTMVMLLVGLLATFGPARRALHIMPTSALREE